MQDEEKMIGALFEVREIGGRRIFNAQRLRSGNWLLVEGNNSSRRTINNDEFTKSYEKVTRDNDRTS